jgi:preprotein translocase subunit SecG
MALLFTVLIVVVSILLILIILVQNPKGGGLSSAFGGDSPQMLGGVKKTTDFLDKATWFLVIGLFALVISMNMIGAEGKKDAPERLFDEVLDNVVEPDEFTE